MVPEVSDDKSSSGSNRFCLAEITEGDEFTYVSRGASICGSVGHVCSHDGNTVHVVYDSMGNEVCVLGKDTPPPIRGEAVILPLGEGAIFAFTPSYPLLS